MCTLLFAWRVFADAPVVVAANRDEAFDRPAEPPAIREGPPRVLAPRDAEAGGTWIGYNECGLVAAVTNRWLDVDRDGERSRGLLVEGCLSLESAEAAARHVERELRETVYDGFQLLLADARSAILLSYDGGLSVRQLSPGVCVVVNVGWIHDAGESFAIPDRRSMFGEQQVDTARKLHARTQPEPPGSAIGDSTLTPASTSDPGPATVWLERAVSLLADHELGCCVHRDGYGTRSSTVVRTGESPEFAHASGPPCETDYEGVPVPEGWR